MSAVYEYRCRWCKNERKPPIEGPCPHCGGCYRCHKRRIGIEGEDEPLPAGPVSIVDLFKHHENDKDLDVRPTGLVGVDHVFGGGLPRFGAILLCATAGTGKTSWLMELLLTLKVRSLIISTEQSKKDLMRQFKRFGDRIKAAKHMSVDSLTSWPDIQDAIDEVKPKILAIDSLHDVEEVTDEQGFGLASSSGGAVTRVAKEIRRMTAEMNMLAFLVGHVANDGQMMGGSHLRHSVDATLVLRRRTEDEKDPMRILGFKGKTRFGRAGHEALYRMSKDGFKDCGPVGADGLADEPEDDDEDEDPTPPPAPPPPRPAPKGPKAPAKKPKLKLVN
jgi:predicted ATP-dependent serine protease